MKSRTDSNGDRIQIVGVEGTVAVEGGVGVLIDTDGDPLPAGRPVSWSNRSDGQPNTATITSGAESWVYTWTYDGSGYCTAESGWVKQ